MEIVRRLTAWARRIRTEHHLRVLVAAQRDHRARNKREGSNPGLEAEPKMTATNTKPLRDTRAAKKYFSNKANRSL